MHHDAEGGNGCSGSPIARYQFAFSSDTSGLPSDNIQLPRFLTRGEFNTNCDGPVTPAESDRCYFTWDADYNAPAPVLSIDPDINSVPWDPIDDGNWHRHTIEIKTGNGTDSYHKLWLDGNLYLNSFGSPMNMPGEPTSFMFETVSGWSTDAYNSRFDNITLWTD